MRKALVKCVALLLLISLAAVGASATGQGESASVADADVAYTQVGTYPIVESPLTLTFFAPSIPTIVDLKTNTFTEFMEEKTNVRIQWETAPMESVGEKLNLVLASGDYPDVFFSTDMSAAIEELYANQGVFAPLNDLIDDYALNFQRELSRRDGLEEAITAMDGNIYALPSIQDCYHCEYAQKMWINQEWLEVLGLDMPQTTDEFYDVLVAFRDDDPNGNGIPDEIPLAGATDGWHQGVDNFIMNAFIYDTGVYNPIRTFVENGRIDTIVDKPEYREGLRYLRKLYDEGLIYEASFNQTFDQVKQIALSAGPELLGAAPAGHLAMFLDIVSNQERYRHFTALAPLEGPSGTRVATHFKYFAIQPGEYVVSNSNPYPEAAIRYADTYYDYEVQMHRQWGAENEAWREAQPGELGMTGEQALFDVLVPFDEQAQNEHYSWLGLEYSPAELWFGQDVYPTDVDLYSATGFEKLLFVETEEKYEPYKPTSTEVLPPIRYTRDESETINTLSVELESYIEQSKVQFIIGDMDLDADWDSYLANLRSVGLEGYLETVQKAYDRVHR